MVYFYWLERLQVWFDIYIIALKISIYHIWIYGGMNFYIEETM